MKEQWYFVELPYGLNPQNKLQQQAQEVLHQCLQHTVTDHPNNLEFWVQQQVKKLNLQHPRCKPLKVTTQQTAGRTYIYINDNLLSITVKPIAGACLYPDELAGQSVSANFKKLSWKHE